MNILLAKLFEFFKTKSPKLYAVFIGIIGLLWILQGQGVINFPQPVIDTLLALGLVSGAHTTNILKP